MPSSSSIFLDFEDDDSSLESTTPIILTTRSTSGDGAGYHFDSFSWEQDEREGNSTATSITNSSDDCSHSSEHHAQMKKHEEKGVENGVSGREGCNGYQQDSKRQQSASSFSNLLVGDDFHSCRSSIADNESFCCEKGGQEGGSTSTSSTRSQKRSDADEEYQQDWDHDDVSSHHENKKRKKTCHGDNEEKTSKKQKIFATQKIASSPVEKKRERKKLVQETPKGHTAGAGAGAVTSKTPSKKTGSVAFGRRGDPRMNKAVAARLTRPQLTLFQALIIGGFKFQDHVNEVSIKYSDKPIVDSDGVLLSQRKNQLSRRLRYDELRLKRMTAKNRGEGEKTMKVAHGTLVAGDKNSNTTSFLAPTAGSTAGIVDVIFGLGNNNNFLLPANGSIAHQLQGPSISYPFLLGCQTNNYQVQEQLPLYYGASPPAPRPPFFLLQNHSSLGFFDPLQNAINKYHHLAPTYPNGEIHSNSTQYHNQQFSTRMERALSLYNEKKKYLKRRALVASGFRVDEVDEIDELLLGAANGFRQR